LAAILIVEDEHGLGRAIQLSLADEGHDAHWVGTAEEASAWCAARQVDLALVDLRLPRRDGLELLRELATVSPETAVVLMTAHGDVRTAVEAMKLGAADFLLKPIDLDAVSLIARRNLERNRIAHHWRRELQRQSEDSSLDRIIGNSQELEKAKALVRRVSQVARASSSPPPNILITGETGTGKDLIARAIHYEGPRRQASFVQVNCGALPESLAESELFGHVRGAFTDARTSRRGLFDLADQGTLFLDEVCSLPLPVQAKLLTAIESRRIRPVGGTEERGLDVHMVSAMNRDPMKLIAEGKLRADLYHRLRVLEIHLPPLRERGDDIDLLADHFIAAHCRTLSLPAKSLSESARMALRARRWPGNVRELSHCLESAVLMGDEVIESESIPRAADASAVLTYGPHDETVLHLDFSRGPIALEDVERRLLIQALKKTGHNVTQAAALLNISRDTMRYRLEKYGISTLRHSVVR